MKRKTDPSCSSGAGVRAEAARVVARVMGGRSLDEALAAAGGPALAGPDRSLLRALAYGVVREQALLAHLAGRLLDKPLRQQPEVHALLLCGLFQLRSLRVPPHAAVAETVGATALLEAPWARGLVNAVLRRYQRERRTLEEALPTDPAVRYSHPAWLVDAIRADWPRAWKDLLAANNVPGPMTLRANRRRGSAAEYLARLPGAGLSGRRVAVAADAVVLDEAAPVDRLPGFADGAVSVQDAAAQIAVDLLDASPGQRVLDACAAPGGKTAHILERCDCEVVALDADAARLARLRQALDRLGLKATVAAGDALAPQGWWDGRPFDRILLDAPCSGTGVIRRHPDIKWLRRRADIPRMAGAQLGMLRALFPLLAPGGVLVYSVCSVLSAEGAGMVERFLQHEPRARTLPTRASWGEPHGHGRRVAPGGDFDGFYYARLGAHPEK